MTAVRRSKIPTMLVVAVVVLTLAVVGLGGAVIAVKLRPASGPAALKQAEIDGWKAQTLTNPKDDRAQAGYGVSLVAAGRLEEARAAFEEALRLNPKNWVAQIQLGLLVRTSNPPRAEELLLKGAEAASRTNKALAYIALGDLRLIRKDYVGAKKAFQAAIADVYYIIDGYVGLAKALEGLGDRKGALKQYEQALRYAPNNQEIEKEVERLKGRK